MSKNNIYLFCGPDTYRSRAKLVEWKTKFADKYGSNSIHEFANDNGDYRLSGLVQTPGLFSPTTLTIIRNPFKNENGGTMDFDDFIEVSERGLSEADHVLLWQEGGIDKRTIMFKKLQELGKNKKVQITEFNNLSFDEAVKLFAQELKKYGLKIRQDAAELLFKTCSIDDDSLDSWRAAQMIRQLSAYCYGREIISREDVDVLMPAEINEDAFLPLLQAFSKRDSASVASHLNSLVAQASSEPEMLGIISALFDQVKNMFAVLQLSGLTPDQIDENLGFKKGRSRYVLADARRFGRDNLERLMEKILEVEYQVKQGKTILAPALSSVLVGSL